MKIATHPARPKEKSGLGVFPVVHSPRVMPKQDIKLYNQTKKFLIKDGVTFCTAFKCYVLWKNLILKNQEL